MIARRRRGHGRGRDRGGARRGLRCGGVPRACSTTATSGRRPEGAAGGGRRAGRARRDAGDPVVLVDYGLGNLFSVGQALRHVGGGARHLRRPDGRCATAERLVLPGVGAFGDAMDGLAPARPGRAAEPARRRRPFLGICLGMQLMLEASRGVRQPCGLGLIPGRVDRLPARSPASARRSCKIPHVGWRRLSRLRRARLDRAPLRRGQAGDFAYFVHSYAAHPMDPRHRLRRHRRSGARRSPPRSSAATDHGCQFHPEKSGAVGCSADSSRRFRGPGSEGGTLHGSRRHAPLEAKYGLPAEVRFCTRCVISNQRPELAVEYEHTTRQRRRRPSTSTTRASATPAASPSRRERRSTGRSASASCASCATASAAATAATTAWCPAPAARTASTPRTCSSTSTACIR